MEASIRSIEFDTAVEALLSAGGLPVSDLHSSKNVLFFGCSSGDTLAGIVGLEVYGSSALLRSLAVLESGRRAGLGTALVAYAEQQAMARGIDTLYLLTNTAENFFAGRGYARAERDLAPAAIAATREFAELCPSSAAFMLKRLQA